MQENNIDRVHRQAALMVYDLEIPASVRHPVRFFSVRDILRAVGQDPPEICEATIPSIQTHGITSHPPACHCRFCATDLLDTRMLKRTLP